MAPCPAVAKTPFWATIVRGDKFIVMITTNIRGNTYDQARRLWPWVWGSAGLCLVGHKKSAIFVDGRYTVQVTEQVNGNDYDYCHLINTLLANGLWNIIQRVAVGFNPYTMADTQARSIQSTLESGYELVPLDSDPIDQFGIITAEPISPFYSTLWIIQENPLINTPVGACLTGKRG